jgi:hypothetical protein
MRVRGFPDKTLSRGPSLLLIIELSLLGFALVTGFRSRRLPDALLRSSEGRSSLTAFFLSYIESPRIPRLNAYILSHLPETTVRFSYYFVERNSTNDTAGHTLLLPQVLRCSRCGLQRQLLVKFMFAMGYFLDHANSDWFYRGVDDTLVNFRALAPFLRDLERTANPLTDFVFRANCIPFFGNLFPQGGSGYLMSRHAVATWLPHFDDCLNMNNGFEDMDLGRFLLKWNITGLKFGGPGFMGHTIVKPVGRNVFLGKWSTLPICPDIRTIPGEICRPFLARIRDTVFYHHWPLDIEGSFRLSERVFNAPPFIFWYSETGWPIVCRMNESAASG